MYTPFIKRFWPHTLAVASIVNPDPALARSGSHRRGGRSLAPFGAALLAALTIASTSNVAAIEPVPTPEPSDPSPAICVSRTSGSLTATKGPFEGGTQLTWNVAKACPEVTLTLSGQTVAAVGSTMKDPVATSEYKLVASMGGSSKVIGSAIALGGDIVGYAFGRGGPVAFLNPTGPDAVEARRITALITGSLSLAAKGALLGKTLEVHIIPPYAPLTSLPPWSHLAGTMTCDAAAPGCVDPRPWSEVRGAGGRRIPDTNRIATAVGAEELVYVSSRPMQYSPGYVLTHELGHTVLDFAAKSEEANVDAVLDANEPGHDYVGRESYTASNADEYFAEGTAALFEFKSQPWYTSEYTREWLAENDPALLAILNRVYPRAP